MRKLNQPWVPRAWHLIAVCLAIAVTSSGVTVLMTTATVTSLFLPDPEHAWVMCTQVEVRP